MFFQSHGDSSKMKRLELNVWGRELAKCEVQARQRGSERDMFGLVEH
jgi:hypothetical protein